MAPKRAKNAANQEALDRLQELRDKANPESNYIHSIRRAINSLADCPHAIETRKQALQLKYVGPHTAKTIVPQDCAVATAGNKKSASASKKNDPSKAAAPAGNKKKKAAKLDVKDKVSAKQVAHDEAVKEASSLILPKGPWKVTLLLDGREQRAEHVQAKLQMSGVPCEQRHLPIGDMAWMASTPCGIEIMLGTIVERKEVNDLASSLFGTRYLEQRLRLQHCGLPQVLLLVEGNTSTVSNCPADTLHMCMMETRVCLGFQVVETKHLDDTVRFLKNVHRRILQRSFPSAFGDDVPTSLPSFSSPNRKKRRKKAKLSLVDLVMDTPPVPPLGEKRFITYKELKTRVERDREAGTRTVGAIYGAMLKQVPTLSVKKVQAIQQSYPTPNSLLGTYVGLSAEDGKTLVQDFETTIGRERACRVGPKSAAEVYFACTEGGTESFTTAVEEKGNDKEKTSKVKSVDKEETSKVASVDETTSSVSNVARLPDIQEHDDDDDSVVNVADSPLLQPESDSKLPARASTPPRMPLSRQRSPMSPMEELDSTIRRQDIKKPAAAAPDGFVDLTQDSDAGEHVATLDTNRNNDRLTSRAATSLSQGSSSDDSVEDEPLHVRCQRLNQQPADSRKRTRDDTSSTLKDPPSSQEVIEIE